jgi:hypothetical protein
MSRAGGGFDGVGKLRHDKAEGLDVEMEGVLRVRGREIRVVKSSPPNTTSFSWREVSTQPDDIWRIRPETNEKCRASVDFHIKSPWDG